MATYHLKGVPTKATENKVVYRTEDGAYYIPKSRLRSLLGLGDEGSGRAPDEVFITVSTERPDDFVETTATEFTL